MVLNEAESKARLAGFGVPVPAGHCVPAEQASEAAQQVGFPVAVKVLTPFLAHKTEAGAVAVGLRSAAEVRTAVAGMQATFASRGLGSIETVLVESMVCDAVAELIVGVLRDDRLGLALVIGSGGILVELVKDTQHLLLPTSQDSIERALSCLSASKLLAGYRGRPPGDTQGVVKAILAVADFALAHQGRLLELDINPLLVRPKGYGTVAVDALIRLMEA